MERARLLRRLRLWTAIMIDSGLIACVLVVPWAMIFGQLRGIPIGWRLVDCAFGVFGFGPLWLARTDAARLAALTHKKE